MNTHGLWNLECLEIDFVKMVSSYSWVFISFFQVDATYFCANLFGVQFLKEWEKTVGAVFYDLRAWTAYGKTTNLFTCIFNRVVFTKMYF